MRWKQVQQAYRERLEAAHERFQDEMRTVRNHINDEQVQDAVRQYEQTVAEIMDEYDDNNGEVNEADAVDAASQRLAQLKKRRDQERIRKKQAEIQKKQQQIKKLKK